MAFAPRRVRVSVILFGDNSVLLRRELSWLGVTGNHRGES